jgi:hypothetical protein
MTSSRTYVDEMYMYIPGFNKYYLCSYDGTIYRLKDGSFKKIKSYDAKNGYCTVQLICPDGKTRNHGVHTVVASAWLSKPDETLKYVVNHKNYNKRDNRVENLEYVTYSENSKHARQNGRGVKGRKVCQSDLEGNLIEEYDSIVDASKATGINNRTICAVCTGKKGRNSAGGYLWSYSEQFKSETKKRHGCSRAVDQYTLDDKFIKHFESLDDAADEVGCSHGNISRVCSGHQKSAKGYIWKYAPKEEKAEALDETRDWIVLDEYPRYKISKDGKVYSMLYKRVMKGSTTEEGRKYVTVTNKDGVLKTIAVHRLVAMAYIPNPNNYPVVNHLDGDPSNNNIENLEWCSYSRNAKHAYDIGLNSKPKS